MAQVEIFANEARGAMKPMHAVNKGPLGFIIPKQNRCNFEEYRAARIPYARNHDASEWVDFGGHSLGGFLLCDTGLSGGADK